MTKTALITGITGQDGSYLAEFLLEKDYNVIGMVRRTATPNLSNIEHILDQVTLVSGDMLDQTSLERILRTYEPHEVYNLAAQSFVPASFQQPLYTAECTALGPVRMLDAIMATNPGIKFYQASSSEMFGKVRRVPQNERTPFHPRSPYGCAKAYAHNMTVNYRESYGLFACSGILFNHESPRRGFEFVTRKITDAVARIRLGMAGELRLGNINAERDWGYAPDYVRAMWLMLQRETPEDYVIATGYTWSVQQFIEEAFEYASLDWREFVKCDQTLMRPAEVDLLMGDASKANKFLGWQPTVTLRELVRIMVDADLERLSG